MEKTDGVSIRIDVSPGELIDKITILEIKNARIEDPAKLENVKHELGELSRARDETIPPSAELDGLAADLKRVNETLWEIEDDIRRCERKGDFGGAFVALARSIYRNNDARAALKRRINEMLGSAIVEEKSYEDY